MIEARELISRLCYFGTDNMSKKVWIMSEDMDYVVPFDIFEDDGRIILKPNDKSRRVKLV
jgi:hypothetical protein